MRSDEPVLSDELAERLGYQSKSSLNFLVETGELIPPGRHFCTDRRWRRAWPRRYVEALLRDPPPRIARQLKERQRRAPKRKQGSIPLGELARAMGVRHPYVNQLVGSGLLPHASPGRGIAPEELAACLRAGPPAGRPKLRWRMRRALALLAHRLPAAPPPSAALPAPPRRPAEPMGRE